MDWAVAILAYCFGFLSFTLVIFVLSLWSHYCRKRKRPVMVKITFANSFEFVATMPLVFNVSTQNARIIYEDYNNG